MQVLRFKGNIKLPEYIKESIRGLIKSVYDKDVDITIERHKAEKTDPQRKYFWSLVKEIRLALKNGTTENDVYLKILKENGVSEWVPLPENDVHLAKAYYRIVEDRGETTITFPSGKAIKARQLKCWKGLSEYTKEEACMLIDGAIQECEALGIPTDTPEELQKLKELWGIDLGQEA